MIDIHAFVAKWNGKVIPGPIADQCVNVIKEWEKENGWSTTFGNAIDYSKGQAGWQWIKNTPTGVPPAGAAVVFQEPMVWDSQSKIWVEYGHIALAYTGSNQKVLVTFEQNDPLGSAAHIKDYNYINPKCLGWLVKV